MTLRLLLVLIPSTTLIGCGVLFYDNFEPDTAGSPPALSPPGGPANDSLNLFGPTSSIVVVNSALHGSKAVEIERTAQPPQTALECVAEGGPHAAGQYAIRYRAYSVNASGEPALTTTVRSTGGQRAFELRLAGGDFRLSSGNGQETLAVGYAANVIHAVEIAVDMDAGTFAISIDGTDVASLKPFLDSGFGDVHMLRFEYPAPVVDALPGAYVVDTIVIQQRVL